MPGSPPIKTSIPLTMPPPITRSNSRTPVAARASPVYLRSRIRSGLGNCRSETPPLLAFPVTLVLSLRVPQLPQEGHFPLHLVVSKPQSAQKKMVAIFFLLALWHFFHNPKYGKFFFQSAFGHPGHLFSSPETIAGRKIFLA
jgi:hypothetical protein